MSAFSSPNPLYGLSQRPSNQGWLFHPKMPYTGNQDNFSAATGVHSSRFQYVFIQTQSIGGKPPIPPKQFSQANGLRRRRPRKGFFPRTAETHAHVSERHGYMRIYHFFDERLPFRCWEIEVLCSSFGLIEHMRRR